MPTTAEILYEIERRRREKAGLPPPEVPTAPGAGHPAAIASVPSPETSGAFVEEAARGTAQWGAAPVMALGENIEAIGGLLPGDAISDFGHSVTGAGEQMMPEKPVEGVGGAIISGLGRAPVDLPKIHMAMKLVRPLFAGRAGAAAKRALDDGASEAMAAAAATKAARVASYMTGATTFGALGVAETAGLQSAREDSIDFGEVAKAGLRGAATGAVWEAFAPFNIIGRMAGLGAYGAAEAGVFGEDPVEGGVLTAMYGAMGGLKGRNFKAEGKAIASEVRKSIKEAAAEVKALAEGKSESQIADEGVAVMPEAMEMARNDPEMHANALKNLNTPGATEDFARTRQLAHERDMRAAGVPAEEIAKVGKQKYQETIDLINDARATENAYIDAETASIKEHKKKYGKLKVDVERSAEDIQQASGVEKAASENAKTALRITPAEAGRLVEWVAGANEMGKGLRVEAKQHLTKINLGIDVPLKKTQDLMNRILNFLPAKSADYGESMPELSAEQAKRITGSDPSALGRGPAEAGIKAFDKSLTPAVKNYEARLGEAQQKATAAYQKEAKRLAKEGKNPAEAKQKVEQGSTEAPKVEEAAKATAEGQAAERAAREATTVGDANSVRAAKTTVATEKVKAKKAAEAPKSKDFDEHVKKGIEAGLESTKVAKDQAAEAARMKGMGGPETLEQSSPRTKFSSLAQSVFGKEKGQTMTRLADAFAMWQSVRGGVTPQEWWAKTRLESQKFRDYMSDLYKSGAAKPYSGGLTKSRKIAKGQMVAFTLGERIQFIGSAVKSHDGKTGGKIEIRQLDDGKILHVSLDSRLSVFDVNVKDGMPKGLTEFTEKGERIIRAFETSDASTGAHELAHVFRRDLRGEDLQFVNEQFGVKRNQRKWTKSQEEKFAKTFEYWLKTGKTRRKQLVPILRQFKEWMGSIYDAVMPGGKSKQKGEIPESEYFDGIEVSPEMAKFFNDMFSFRELRQPEGAADAYREAVAMGGPEVLNQSSGAFEAPLTAGNAVIEGAKYGAKSMGDLASRGIKRAANSWSKPIVDAIAEWNPLMGSRMRGQMDRAREFVGAFSKDYHALGEMLGKRKYAQAANDLMEIIEIEGTDAGIARIAMAIEGKKIEMSPAEVEIVKQVQKLIELQATMAEGNHKLTKGAMILQMTKAGKYTQFKGREGGQILLQQFTGEAYHALELGSGKMHDAWVKELSRMNNVPVEVGKRMVASMRSKVLQSRSAFEVTRDLPEFPTHLKIDGKWVPVIETNPLKFAERMINNTAMRLSFLKEFGKVGDIWTNAELLEGGKLESMVNEFAGSGQNASKRAQLMRDALRGLNGVPIEMKPRFGPAPGEPGYDAIRFAKFMESGLKTALLTRSLIPNIPESFGNTQAFGGVERYAKAMKMIAEDPKMWAVETARSGARTEFVRMMLTEPSRQMESWAIKIRDIIGRGTGHMYANEFNEMHAAVVGRIFKNDAMAGRLHVGDAQRLTMLKFTEPQIKQLMEYKKGETASKELQDLWSAIETRFPEASQGSTSFAVERSRWANSRTYNHLIFADRYAQMKFDRTMREVSNIWNEMHPEEGVWKRPSKEAMKQLSSYFMGSAASGLSASFLVAFAVGGPAGVSSWFEQSQDDRLGTVIEATKYNIFGGPADAIWRGLTSEGERSILGQLGEATLPGNVIQEGFDFFHGYGRYKNRSLSEKAVEFMKSEVSASKPMLTWMAVAGFGKDAEITAAKSAFWKWRRDELPAGRFTKSDLSKSDSDMAFGINMRRAYDAMTEGDIAKAEEAVAAALQSSGKDPKSAKASIRMRVILGNEFRETSAEGRKNRDALRKRIGARAFNALLRHDALLKSWAGRL